ncbi:hypothetical protein F4823DRAFT_559647 [Ustulina deusta]|nr:hypothetical protein F4823DRAFT_559647 [Ustulina deusta]
MGYGIHEAIPAIYDSVVSLNPLLAEAKRRRLRVLMGLIFNDTSRVVQVERTFATRMTSPCASPSQLAMNGKKERKIGAQRRPRQRVRVLAVARPRQRIREEPGVSRRAHLISAPSREGNSRVGPARCTDNTLPEPQGAIARGVDGLGYALGPTTPHREAPALLPRHTLSGRDMELKKALTRAWEVKDLRDRSQGILRRRHSSRRDGRLGRGSDAHTARVQHRGHATAESGRQEYQHRRTSALVAACLRPGRRMTVSSHRMQADVFVHGEYQVID